VTSFSKFEQYFTGVYNGGDGKPTSYTVGTTVTPDAAAMTPSSSNCVTVATIANAAVVTGGGGAAGGNSNAGSSGSKTTQGGKSTAGAGSPSDKSKSGDAPPPSGSSAAFRAARVPGTGAEFIGIVVASAVAAIAAIGLLH
jgi:hypothetical protein